MQVRCSISQGRIQEFKKEGGGTKCIVKCGDDIARERSDRARASERGGGGGKLLHLLA